MIKLKSLTLKGFRSFNEEQTLKFPDTGLMLLTGIDVRTGGGSGSGKSSILEAIFYVLGLNALPATELKNHDSETMEITLELESGDDSYLITRSSSRLVLIKNGIAETGMKASLQEKIDKLLVIPEIFQTLSYRRQDEQGKFFYTEDSKLKSFFSQCIPELDQLEEAAGKASDRHGEILKQKEILDAKLSSLKEIEVGNPTELALKITALESSLLTINDQSQRLKDKLKELSNPDSSIAEFRAKASVSVGELLKKKKELSEAAELKKATAIAPLKDQLTALEVEYKVLGSNKTSIENELSSIKSKLESIARSKRDSKELEDQLRRLKTQLNSIKENKCPTCLRGWDESAVKEQEILGQIEAKGRLLFAIHKEIGQEESLARAAEDNKTMKAEIERQIQQKAEAFSAKRDEISQESFRVANESAHEIREIDNNIMEIDRSIDSFTKTKNLEREQAKNSINEALLPLVQQESQYLSQIRETKESLLRSEKVLKEMSVINSTLAVTEKDLETEFMIHKILGRQGVLGLIIENLLTEIEADINTLSSGIPNCNDISVKIQSTNQTKSGTTQTKITPIITKSGHQISFKSLSGGQRSSLSLCADLAMFNAIKRRTNITPGFVAFDEVMDGLDAQSKEAAIETIKNYAGDRLVIMIDHSTEIKEAFTQIVTVEYDGKTSRIL